MTTLGEALAFARQRIDRLDARLLLQYATGCTHADLLARPETPVIAPAHAQFAEWVDVDYFTDYLVYRSYIADSDMLNQAYWRAQDYSVKWRPILFDLDYGLFGNQYSQDYKKDILQRYFYEDGVRSPNGSRTNMDIYVGLYKNAQWRKKFVARYIELMSTTLSPEHMLALLDEMDDDYLAEMPRQKIEAV